MSERTMIRSSALLAALIMAGAMAGAARPARQEREEAPEPEIAPEPVQPVSRQQRRYLERQAAKAARRKPPA